jgi:positive regulator of sigma E activity
MHDVLHVNRAMLPWLLPLVMVLAVVVTVLAPSVIIAVLGVAIFGGLGFLGVPLYYRHYQQRAGRHDSAG